MQFLLICLFTLLPLATFNTYSWDPLHDIKKGTEKAADIVASGAKATAHEVKKLDDKYTAFHVSYHKIAGYNLGIKKLAIKLIYPDGTTITAPLIKQGQGLKNGNTAELTFRVSMGGSSSLASDLLSNSSSDTSTTLHFALAYNEPTLNISSSEHITTTTTNNYGTNNYGNSSQNNYGNYQDNTQVQSIGSSAIDLSKIKKLVPTSAPSHYQVIINGKTTSKTPLFRPFYLVIS